MDLEFRRELRITGIELPDEFDVAARSMVRGNAQLLISNSPARRWVVSCSGDTGYSSYVIQSAVAAPPEPPPALRYWVRRLLLRSERAIRIGGIEVDALSALPLEQLLRLDDPFALVIRAPNERRPPISDRGALIELEIATDSRAVAELLCSWLGGTISESRITSQAYSHELEYFFRPPVQSTTYYPDGVLSRSPDLLQLITADPLRLTRHALICGQAGSGKTNTARLLILTLFRARRPEGLLILDPRGEYTDLAAIDPSWSIQAIAAGQHPEQLGLLNINPFLPAPTQRLDAHLDLLATIMSVSAFRGAGANLPAYMRQFLRMFVTHRWARANNWEPAATPTREQRRAILSKTGDEVRAEKFLSSPRGSQSVLMELCEYWDANRRRVLDEMIGGQAGTLRADLEGVLTARMNELEFSLLGHFDYTPQGRPLAALLRTPAIISLQFASESDIELLVSLLALGTVEAALLLPPASQLRALILIEEAHRVMLRESGASAEFQSAKGRLSGTFARAFRELRSRGVGLIAVDQSPHTLIDEAFANTGVKIAHRLHLPDDQESIARVFQVKDVDLASFEVGECLIKADEYPAYRTRLRRWDAAP